MKQLTEKIYIDCDDLQYTLYERKIAQKGKNKGKEVYTTLGYYSNIKQVNNALIERGIKEWITGEWNDMLRFVKETQSNLAELK
jgi:hypothetical protein